MNESTEEPDTEDYYLTEAEQHVGPNNAEYTFDPELYRGLEDSVERAEFLTELIEFEIESLATPVAPYFKDPRGTLVDGTLMLQHLEFDEGSESNGTVDVDFEESWHYGCSDANGGESHQVQLKFEVNQEQGLLTVVGPEKQERTTRNEF